VFILFLVFLLFFTNGCSDQQKGNNEFPHSGNVNSEIRDDDMNEKYMKNNQIVIPIDQLVPSRLETATLALG